MFHDPLSNLPNKNITTILKAVGADARYHTEDGKVYLCSYCRTNFRLAHQSTLRLVNKLPVCDECWKDDGLMDQMTVAVVTPEVLEEEGRLEELVRHIEDSGFLVVDIYKELLTSEDSRMLLESSGADESLLDSLINHLLSGPCCLMCLAGVSAIDRLQKVLGNWNPHRAKDEQPESIRAGYGTDEVRVGIFAGTDPEAIGEQLVKFFPEAGFEVVEESTNTTMSAEAAAAATAGAAP